MRSVKGQLNVKHALILVVILLVLGSIAGGVYYFTVEEKPKNDITPILNEVYPTDFKFDKEATARNEKLLNSFIHDNNINEKEFRTSLKKFKNQLVESISNSLSINSGQAEELVEFFTYKRSLYTNLNDEDGYYMAYIDLLSFEDKIEEEITLPQEYVNNPLFPDNYVLDVAPLGLVSKNMEDLIEEHSETPLSESEKEKMYLDLIHYVNDEVKQSPYLSEILHCSLGKLKIISLNIPNLIGDDDNVDFIADRIVYDSKGEIIIQSSSMNSTSYSMENHNSLDFVFRDIVGIPLNFPEGRYIVEYIINDKTKDLSFIQRIPLDCNRDLMVSKPIFVEIENKKIITRANKAFKKDSLITVMYTIAGFSQDVTKEDQIYNVWKLIDENAKTVFEMTNGPFQDMEFDKNNFEEIIDVISFPVGIEPGDYTLVLTSHFLKGGEKSKESITAFELESLEVTE